MLTGHGCFRAYLYRIQQAEDIRCFYCGNECDSPEHCTSTYEDCTRWENDRRLFSLDIGEDVKWNRILALFLESPSTRNKVKAYITTIMKQKETDEWETQRRVTC